MELVSQVTMIQDFHNIRFMTGEYNMNRNYEFLRVGNDGLFSNIHME
jgi:hypothetical protein